MPNMLSVKRLSGRLLPYVFAVGVGVGSWLLMNTLINRVLPGNWIGGISTEDAWSLNRFYRTRDDLLDWTWLMGLTMVLATLATWPLLRAIPGDQSAPFGAFEFFLGLGPFIYFLPALTGLFVLAISMPFFLFASLICSIRALLAKGRRKDVWAFPGTLFWMLIFILYMVGYWNLSGD